MMLHKNKLPDYYGKMLLTLGYINYGALLHTIGGKIFIGHYIHKYLINLFDNFN